jgi:hypothetical protein
LYLGAGARYGSTTSVPALERRAVPNPNANRTNAITKHFFPIIEEFLLLFRGFNPTMIAKLPKKLAGMA